MNSRRPAFVEPAIRGLASGRSCLATGIISVGGLDVRVSALKQQERPPEWVAVGKAVELRRREKRLSAE